MEILRDRFGVPHCYAASEDEAFEAQGRVHATDRLWQMEYDRRRAQGRMAEILGPAAVAGDAFHRRVDLTSFVLRDLDSLAPATVAMLEAYARGVNGHVASAPLPREFAVAGVGFDPWLPWHCLLVFRVRHLLMGSARSKLWRSVVAGVVGPDVARTMASGTDSQLACVPPGEVCAPVEGDDGGDVEGGSNNWAIGGGRTASGLPLLAGDPHRELEIPNVYVQGHVACPDWDVLGIGMPGVPGFCHFGHNERVAWSITHGMADDQDLYVVAPGSVTPDRREVIEVRGGPNHEVDVTLTGRGPLIGDDLALSWTALVDVNTGFDAMAPMLRAATVAELFEAMRPWVEPVNSLVAADVHGDIGYLLRGRLPRRRSSAPTWMPVAADDAAHGWDGWVPFDDLPRVENPPEGFVFSANNRICADPHSPYVGVDVAPRWRAERIVDRLRTIHDATISDMAELHRDAVSLPGRRLSETLADWPPLAGWDGTMAAYSLPAAAYSVVRRELLLLVLERSGLANHRHPHGVVLPGVVLETTLWRALDRHVRADDTSLLGGWTWDDAWAEARRRADASWSGEPWGTMHKTSQRHVLAGLDPTLDPPERVSLDGDLDTVFSSSYTPTAGFAVKAGSVARYAFDLADWDRSGWVVPLGAAGAGDAVHGTDQQAPWADGLLVPAPYTRAAVEAACL